MSVKEDIPAVFLSQISPRGLEAIQKTKDFVNDYCIPADEIYFKQVSTDPAKRWKTIPPIIETLKSKAKELGLWNMFLSNIIRKVHNIPT